MSVRPLAAASANAIKKTKLSNWLELRQVMNPTTKTQHRPVVLFLPFIGASDRVVDKFCDLYHSRGLDIICGRANSKHFLWPPTARKAANELIDFIDRCHQNTLNPKLPKLIQSAQTPLLVHSLSVGSYMHTVTCMELTKKNSKMSEMIIKSIKGEVYDSVVYGDPAGGMEGVITAITSNKLARALIKCISAAYFKVTERHTTDFHKACYSFIENHPTPAPKMFLYSKNDKMSDAEAVHQLIQRWRNVHGLSIVEQCWQDSPHALHMRTHPEAYKKLVGDFVEENVCGDVIQSKL